jgi:hypothetical protein
VDVLELFFGSEFAWFVIEISNNIIVIR